MSFFLINLHMSLLTLENVFQNIGELSRNIVQIKTTLNKSLVGLCDWI